MKINGNVYTIGCDPEVFVSDGNGFISGHTLIKGSKHKPFPVEGGAVQVDGMALEFNIDPASDLEGFMSGVNNVMGILENMLENKSFIRDCTVTFDQEFFDNVPKRFSILGCGADYNAWDNSVNKAPDATKLMRTAGGHVHIGGFETNDPFNEEHFNKCAHIARCLDLTLGTYSLLWDQDQERRSMYGRAGSFRPKSYGMEYRTLSNKWIFDNRLIEFIYKGVERALYLVDSGYDPKDKAPYVQEIINEGMSNHPFFKGNITAERLVA